VNDALELGRSSEGIVTKTSFPLSNFVAQTLVEIFDLTDHRTADRIRECSSCADLKKILSEKGIFLEMEEGLWHQERVLDVSKARQILRNLLNNALKYRKRRVDLRIEEGEHCLHFYVRDDGEGIPANFHQKIFQCYFQMDMQADHCVRGHGLGLAGVQVLLEDMGGEMSLESDVGQGAAFSVKIPW
jgi:signal transduction histidine kinase